MIVYRSQERNANPAELLARLRTDDPVELLIDFGELESAVVDSISPDSDSHDEITSLFREAARLTGHAFLLATRGQRAPLEPLRSALDRLSMLPLPHSVRMSVPEGYAYYGLYPETYIEAAARFRAEVEPRVVVAIGIRSIGTSLSAVVWAALEAAGCRVHSFTVRPRGHPFDRQLALSPRL
ncbi:MAG: hypothetical protein M1436_04320, partial [Acidobacteria bacterium]|nr:hypothetical protein [Acidobacteriota bacterium]